MEPLVSVIMCTIRPFPRWKLMLDSMEKQTFQDFEYVIVDGLFHKRKKEMKRILRNYSFPVTYITDKPWFHSEQIQSGKRPGIASARNTGVVYARGSLLVIHDDNSELPPDWVKRHVKAFEAGFDGMAGLQHRLYGVKGLEKYGEHYFVDGKHPNGRCIPCHVQNKSCTHVEKRGKHTLIRDYRGDYTGNVLEIPDWETGKTLEYHILPIGWLYCCNTSVRTEYMLKINGFPEEFCGEMGSEDSFMAVCLQRVNAKLVLDKKSYIIHYSDEAHVDFNEMFNFKNKELVLMDGKMHFSNEKHVEDLLKDMKRYRSNPHLNLREMRIQKLKELN